MTGVRTGGSVECENCYSLVRAEFINLSKPAKLKCPLCGAEWYVKDESGKSNNTQKTS